MISLVGGLGFLAAAIFIESKYAEAPLVPLSIFRRRSLSAANGIAMAIGAALFGMYFFVSLYRQQVRRVQIHRCAVSVANQTRNDVIDQRDDADSEKQEASLAHGARGFGVTATFDNGTRRMPITSKRGTHKSIMGSPLRNVQGHIVSTTRMLTNSPSH